VHRDSQAARTQAAATPVPASPGTTSGLHEAASLDLATLRLLLREHLDHLRALGAPEEVLRPLEGELRRFDETVDDLIEGQHP